MCTIYYTIDLLLNNIRCILPLSKHSFFQVWSLELVDEFQEFASDDRLNGFDGNEAQSTLIVEA